jgi:hypothetical protein
MNVRRRQWVSDLDKAFAATLGIDLLEALLLVSLVDDADGGKEETQNGDHERVHSAGERTECENVLYGWNKWETYVNVFSKV